MQSTHFDNPHGLPSEGHKTTARDLAQLGPRWRSRAAVQKTCLHSAARHDRGFGVRLQTQRRLA